MTERAGLVYLEGEGEGEGVLGVGGGDRGHLAHVLPGQAAAQPLRQHGQPGEGTANPGRISERR